MKGALAHLDDNAAIAEIASGVLSKQIAARYGVTPFAVRKRLAKHPDYAQAVKDQAASLVEDATELAMRCREDEVAIARVRVDAAHKWAAARDPAAWAQKSQVTLEVGPDLGEVLMRAQRRVIEAAVVSAPPDAPEDGALEAMDVLSNRDSGG